MRIFLHEIEYQKEIFSCWSYVTDGLAEQKQKETSEIDLYAMRDVSTLITLSDCSTVSFLISPICSVKCLDSLNHSSVGLQKDVRRVEILCLAPEREITMTADAIRSKEEAREQLRRLEQFYGGPVLPLENFCNVMSIWMDCIVKNNTDPMLKEGGAGHGREYFERLKAMHIDIRKSNLLGRLLYGKEALRTRVCPVHKGHYSGEAMFFEKCPYLCDGTGWLRERDQDGGYTGIKVSRWS